MAVYKNIAYRVANLKLNNDKAVSEICEILNVSERTVRRALKYYEEHCVHGAKIQKLKIEDVSGFPSGDCEPKANYSFILTPDFLTISKISDDEMLTETIENTADDFNDVVQLIMDNGANQRSLKDAFAEISAREQLMKLTMGRIEIDATNGTVAYAGRPIATRLEARIVEAARDQNEDALNGLVNFTERLHQNPSKRAVDGLFQFLEAADIVIDRDGMVHCYKKVRNDFTDIRTGTFDNSVGSLCEMDRNMVDENPDNTCSAGLHVCSKAYLPYFGGGNCKVVRVEVDPSDFVSIPSDYYSTGPDGSVKAKARVSKYRVLNEL